jgi:hypothetical protein
VQTINGLLTGTVGARALAAAGSSFAGTQTKKQRKQKGRANKKGEQTKKGRQGRPFHAESPD